MKRLISLTLSIAICFTFLFTTATPASAYQLRGYKVDEPLIFYAYSGFALNQERICVPRPLHGMPVLKASHHWSCPHLPIPPRADMATATEKTIFTE